MVAPVQPVSQTDFQSAAHSNNGRLIVAVSRVQVADPPLDLGCRAGKKHQLGHLPPVQRQLQYPLVVQQRSNTCVPCFHQRCIRLYFDSLGDASHFQDRVDHRVRIDLQHDSGLNKRPEPRQAGFEPIGSHLEALQCIVSGLIGYGSSGDSRGRLGCGHFDARQNGAALVGDPAINLRCRLCPDYGRRQDQQQRYHQRAHSNLERCAFFVGCVFHFLSSM